MIHTTSKLQAVVKGFTCDRCSAKVVIKSQGETRGIALPYSGEIANLISARQIDSKTEKAGFKAERNCYGRTTKCA